MPALLLGAACGAPGTRLELPAADLLMSAGAEPLLILTPFWPVCDAGSEPLFAAVLLVVEVDDRVKLAARAAMSSPCCVLIWDVWLPLVLASLPPQAAKRAAAAIVATIARNALFFIVCLL